MPNLQKKRLLIFEIYNIKKCTLFLEPSIYSQVTRLLSVFYLHFNQMSNKRKEKKTKCAFATEVCPNTSLYIIPSRILTTLTRGRILETRWEKEQMLVLAFFCIPPKFSTLPALPGWLSGVRVGLMASWPGGYKFETRLRGNSFRANFRL